MTAFRLILLMCFAEALSMAGFSAVPALLPVLQNTWHLSAWQAGVLGGSYFAGYVVSISWLSSLTDHVDARRVFLLGTALAGLGSLGFYFLAHDLVSACLFQAVTGAGLAGTYMPGLRALTDRIETSLQPRFIAFYTSTFGIGASLSYAFSGWVGTAYGWPAAFCLAGILPLLAGLLVWRLLPAQHPVPHPRLSMFKTQWVALKNAEIRRHVLGYCAHCWELFGFRAWIVALLTYAGTQSELPLSATAIAALVNLFGIPASILGNEAAIRGDRHRHILRVMLASGALAWLTGFLASTPWLLIAVLPVYFAAIMADSAALTAGLVASTNAQNRGSAMAVYSLGGFGAGFIAPVMVGVLLDLAGGQKSALAWLLACGSLGVWCLVLATHTLWKRFAPSPIT